MNWIQGASSCGAHPCRGGGNQPRKDCGVLRHRPALICVHVYIYIEKHSRVSYIDNASIDRHKCALCPGAGIDGSRFCQAVGWDSETWIVEAMVRAEDQGEDVEPLQSMVTDLNAIFASRLL